MTIPPVSPTTTAVLERLQSTGLPVGDARKPPEPEECGWQGAVGQSEFITYLVLYPILTLRDGPDSSLADRYTDPQFTYQVTAVGVDRLTAEMAQDLAIARLCNGIALDIPGRSTVFVRHESSQGTHPDEVVNSPLFYCVDRFRVDTSTP